MLEGTAIAALLLLAVHEFLDLRPGARARRAAWFAGWAAVPVLLLFGILVTARAVGFLGDGTPVF